MSKTARPGSAGTGGGNGSISSETERPKHSPHRRRAQARRYRAARAEMRAVIAARVAERRFAAAAQLAVLAAELAAAERRARTLCNMYREWPREELAAAGYLAFREFFAARRRYNRMRSRAARGLPLR